MVQTGGAPARGTAAATASMKRRKATNGKNSGGAAGSILQFYARDAPRFKVSPLVVIWMSIGFIACVVILHVMSKFYLVR